VSVLNFLSVAALELLMIEGEEKQKGYNLKDLVKQEKQKGKKKGKKGKDQETTDDFKVAGSVICMALLELTRMSCRLMSRILGFLLCTVMRSTQWILRTLSSRKPRCVVDPPHCKNSRIELILRFQGAKAMMKKRDKSRR